ncbi:MAG TPA: alpha/beta hydrolase [Alphaproteobacteria bacterium]|nr:alpha/beta hydrolase [Alphaproteobacteria bacterium]
MPYFKSPDGTRLHYRDWGGGPPIVLVHGNNVDSNFWEYQVTVLGEHGCRAIVPDRRGHGRSDYVARGFDYDTYAGDLAALLEHADVRDATLVGHSTGANAIARYLARYGAERIAGAVLVSMVSPMPILPEDRAAIEAAQLVVDSTINDRPKFFASLKEAFFASGASQEAMDALIARTLTVPLEVAVKTARTFLDPRSDNLSDLRAFTVPTLIVHGDKDSFSPFENSGRLAHQAIPGSRLLLYEGASHGLTISEQGRFTSDLIAFIEELSLVSR